MHPYLSQQKLITFCKDKGIIITAYSPLGSPDRPWAQPSEPKLLEDAKLIDISRRYCKSPAQVILRWCLQRGIQMIPKSVTFSRIKENFNIFDFCLSDENMSHINTFECNGRMVVPKIDGKFRDAAHPHFPFNIDFWKQTHWNQPFFYVLNFHSCAVEKWYASRCRLLKITLKYLNSFAHRSEFEFLDNIVHSSTNTVKLLAIKCLKHLIC